MPSKSTWNDPLKLVSACALCEGAFSAIDARVLGDDGDTALVHATCRRCRASALSIVVTRGEAGTALSFATDLSADDALRLRSARTVSVDDVIELHSFIEGSGLARLAGAAEPAKKRRVRTKTHQKRP